VYIFENPSDFRLIEIVLFRTTTDIYEKEDSGLINKVVPGIFSVPDEREMRENDRKSIIL
jgi:hypothetical protein